MAQLTCRTIENQESGKFNAFVQQHGTVFATTEWLNTLEGSTHTLGLYNGNDDLMAVTALKIVRRYGVNIVLRAPFTPHSGPYFTPELVQSKAGIEAQRELQRGICEFLKRRKVAICCLPLDPTVVDCLVFKWAGYKVIPAHTYTIDLEKSKEQIEANLTSVRRRNIRAAKKAGIEVQSLHDYKVVSELAQKTFARQKKKLPIAIMQRILFNFANEKNSFAAVALKNDQPISCVFCVNDRKTAYYLIGGYDEDRGHHGAGAACMHEAILMAHSQGLKTFDFEGSSIPAIERYFRGFGGELTTYPTINRAWLPIELALKFKKRDIF